MRIVHLANFYGPKSGGLRTMMLQSATLLSAAGHEIWHIVPGLKDEIIEFQTHTQISIKSPIIPKSGGYRMIRRPAEVINRLREITPHVIEISDRLTLLSVADWAKHENIPTVMFAHERIDGVVNAHFRGMFAEQIADMLNKSATTRVDAIVATTEFAAGEFRRIGINPMRIPLGVDLQTFRPNRRRPRHDESLRIGICSRLSKEKRADFAIEVTRAAVNSGLPVELNVIGDGPLLSSMKKAAQDLPVTFVGFVRDREELANRLANLDVLLAPGPIETFGLAALEGLASGTPVIVNQASALPEVVGAAGVAAPLEAALWVAGIQRLTYHGTTADSAARLTARAQAERFPWSEFGRKLSKLHHKLIHNREFDLSEVW